MSGNSEQIRITSEYCTMRLIGKGGTGEVYEGIHIPTQKRVAVKLIGSAASIQSMERFIRAAQMTAGLRHKHICSLIDFGMMGNDRPFLVMEYLDGITFAEYLKRPDIDCRLVIEVMSQMLSALEAAHRQQLLHRDFKPGNIQLLSDSPGAPFAKLMDFGAMKAVDATAFTGNNIAVGTAMYMSPEQAMGMKYDHRIDIYAAGVVLYEALTGRTPYRSTASEQIIMDIVSGRPVVYPSEVNYRIPSSLEEIITRAMARLPRKRYQTAGQMREAIDQLKGSPELKCLDESTDEFISEFEEDYETRLT